MKNILKRFKSPVVWLGILAAIYTSVLQPELDLPDWTSLISGLAMIFGFANNPTERTKF